MEKFFKQFTVIFIIAFALFGCVRTPPAEPMENEAEKETEKKTDYLGPTPEQLASEKTFSINVTDPHVFEAPGLGRLVTVGENTVVKPAKMPDWSDKPWLTQPLATAGFERQNGQTYQVFVYELRENEILMDWMKRSTAGDSFFSEQMVQTKNGQSGYVYATNDLGAIADVHVTIPTEQYVYIFKDFEEQEELPWRVPADFLNFIQELEVQ